MAPKPLVAVIGGGPAGLCAAWALGYAGCEHDKLSLAGHAFSKTDHPSVVDIPMRVFSGKYYTNSRRLINHLDVERETHKFQYVFSKETGLYFQFFSNFHCLPKVLGDISPIKRIFMLLSLMLCYFWFTLACFCISPKITVSPLEATHTESFKEYARRIWLPEFFMDSFLLPMFASLGTCSHEDIRNMPAAYIVDYRRGTFASKHETTVRMRDLEDRLLSTVTDVRHQRRVVSVVVQQDKQISVRSEAANKTVEDHFDYVVPAVSAGRAAEIYPPCVTVVKAVNSRSVMVRVKELSDEQRRIAKTAKAGSEILLLDTVGHSKGRLTRAVHLHPSRVCVSVEPHVGDNAETMKELEGRKDELHSVLLSRPLPTTHSHKVLLEAFDRGRGREDTGVWRNGSGNVYLAGGAFSAGMPLLEACVRSGLEAAEAITAEAAMQSKIHRPRRF